MALPPRVRRQWQRGEVRYPQQRHRARFSASRYSYLAQIHTCGASRREAGSIVSWFILWEPEQPRPPQNRLSPLAPPGRRGLLEDSPLQAGQLAHSSPRRSARPRRFRGGSVNYATHVRVANDDGEVFPALLRRRVFASRGPPLTFRHGNKVPLANREGASRSTSRVCASSTGFSKATP